MKVAKVQFTKWDKTYYFLLNNLPLEKGSRVIVETEMGQDLGEVVGLEDINQKHSPENVEAALKEMKPVLRIATAEDLAKLPSAKEKQEALTICRQLIEKRGLEMKLVDVAFSISDNRVNFAFIADGRIDFRELVKDLTSRFNKLIRLTQIGIRDEARFAGDCGHCGRQLCCRGFLKDFSSIGSEMAEAQQVIHRGSERISGVCGRLMCCLSYEYEGYKEMAARLPNIGDKITVEGKKGTVIGCHVLKQILNVEIIDPKEGRTIIQVDYKK
jgi:cell fate regulator YaaT (PSP1 superfamily)